MGPLAVELNPFQTKKDEQMDSKTFGSRVINCSARPGYRKNYSFKFQNAQLKNAKHQLWNYINTKKEPFQSYDYDWRQYALAVDHRAKSIRTVQLRIHHSQNHATDFAGHHVKMPANSKFFLAFHFVPK